MSNDTLVIINEQRVGKDKGILKYCCEQHLPGSVVRFTSSAQEAKDIISEGRPRITIAVGGDGTLTHALQAVKQLKGDRTLGIIPYGTGNDYALSLGLHPPSKKMLYASGEEPIIRYLKPFIATHKGLKAYQQLVDVGKFSVDNNEPTYFLNFLGIGFFAEVSKRAEIYNGNDKPYLRETMRLREEIAKKNNHPFETITYYKDKPTIIKTAPAISLDIFIGKYFGDGKHINPLGSIDDGVAEVISVNTANFFPFYINMAQVLCDTKLHLKSENVDYDEDVKRLSMYDLKGRAVQFDGEIYHQKGKTLDFELLPRAITMITNGSGK